MSERLFSVLIPTWNNPQFLDPLMQSIHATGNLSPIGLGEVIIVNNGKQPIKEQYSSWENVKVIDSPENVGWEGGLKLGLEASKTRFVCFQNDDTFIPHSSFQFYEKMLIPFQDKSVAAVGPATTVAAGLQSIYHPQHPFMRQDVNWLIFFTVMIRREYLDAVGGVDNTLPGGDDFDLSMRFNDAGYKTCIAPMAFLIHHGFKTGTRVQGDHTVDGGWNSPKMQERTNKALIQKHGFKRFYEVMSSQAKQCAVGIQEVDREGNLIRQYLKEGDKVLELGCGTRKTVPWAVGVDRVPSGEASKVSHDNGDKCVADINADVSGDIPTTHDYDVVICRHILEHILDTTAVIKNWAKYLKPGGHLIIAVPDHRVVDSIPLNPEHLHAFIDESLKSVVESTGLVQVKSFSAENNVSFISIFKKPEGSVVGA